MIKFDPKHTPTNFFNLTACIALACVDQFLASETAKQLGFTSGDLDECNRSDKHVEIEIDEADLKTILNDFVTHNIVADFELFPIASLDYFGYTVGDNAHTRIEDGVCVAYITQKSEEDTALELIQLKKNLNDQGIFAADDTIHHAIQESYPLGWVYG